MNLVSVLVAPAIVAMSVGDDANDALRYSLAIGAALVIVGAVWISKRRPVALDAGDTGDSEPAAQITA
jgi:K(+)-stimulated pyrophosphate-energized sodium pump